MSEAKAKAARRQMRRAVGPELVEMVSNHGATIRSQGTAIASVANELQTHRMIVTEMVKLVSAEARERVDLRTDALRRPFWGRLRWLVTGR
jgi:hypothetical protein